eukprot:gene2394-22548_t
MQQFLSVIFGLAASAGVLVNNAKPRYDLDGNIVNAHQGRVTYFGTTKK